MADLQINALRAATTRFHGSDYYVSFVRRPGVRIGFLVVYLVHERARRATVGSVLHK